MSYMDDSIYHAIQQTRIAEVVEDVISTAWNQWSNWVRIVNIRPDLTHYRPFKGGRVTLKACAVQKDTGELLREIHLFLQIYPDRRDAVARLEKEDSRHHVPPPLYIPELQAVLWITPNIPRLRKLRELLKHENFRHLLLPDAEDDPDRFCQQPPKLLRLVPRKRAILTWDDPRHHAHYFVKLFNKTDVIQAAHNFQQIMQVSRQEKFDFLVPEIIHCNLSCRTILMSRLPGKNFTEEMIKTVPSSFERVGRVIGQLHKSKARPQKTKNMEREFASIRHHMGEIKRALPQVATRLDAMIMILADTLDNLARLPRRPIHGNLFGDQILYGPDSIGIVDWDAFCHGDPIFDIGRLIAHFIFLAGTDNLEPVQVKRCIKAFLQAYRDETDEPVNQEWLNWHVAAQLLMRGKISALRKLPAGWTRQLGFVVQEAETLARGQSRYLDPPSLVANK